MTKFFKCTYWEEGIVTNKRLGHKKKQLSVQKRLKSIETQAHYRGHRKHQRDFNGSSI